MVFIWPCSWGTSQSAELWWKQGALLQAALKTTEEVVEEDKDKEAVTANVAAANKTGVDAAGASVLSELDGIFTKKEYRTALRALLALKDWLALAGVQITPQHIMNCHGAVTHV